MNSQIFCQNTFNNKIGGNYNLPLIETKRVPQDNIKTSSVSGVCNLHFSLDTAVEIGSPIYLFDQESRSHTSSLNKASKKISKVSPLSQDTPKRVSAKRHNKARNPWTPKEDQKLVELMKKYGQSWAMISSLMEGRTGKQVRDRFLNKLRPNIKCGDWSQREDEILISLLKEFGNKWSLIATHLPGRTEAQVKNRYYSNIKKRLQNDGSYSSVFDSKTGSENTTSFGSSPQEDNGFEFTCELDFDAMQNSQVNFNTQVILNENTTVSYIAKDESPSSQGTATQVSSPQSSSECNYDLDNVISYDQDETLFFTQMQRCGSFLFPTMEENTYFDNTNNQSVNQAKVLSEIDSFFAGNFLGNAYEVKESRLDQLTKRKAFLELELASTLQEINYL